MTTSRASCHTCKVRRIKCDETKPVCQRCTKSKRICIAVPAVKQPSFAIHIENQFASGKSKRPRGPRSRLTVPHIHADLETRAVAYYLQYHLQVIADAPIAMGGLSECVAAWRSSGLQDEMVDLALSSMALAVYSRTQCEPQAATKASSKYYQLLKIVQARINRADLSTLSERDIDACLLTIFLMGRYEGIMYENRQQRQEMTKDCLKGLLHHDGAMAILEVWSNSLNHPKASEIVKQTRRGQIRSAVMRKLLLPEWLQDGSRYGEQDMDLIYDRVIVRIVALRDSVACLHKQQDVQTSKIEQLSQDAQAIDDALHEWMSPFKKACPRYRHSIPTSDNVPTPHFYSRMVHSYSNPGHAVVWTQFYGARMLLSSTYSRLLELEGHGPFLCGYRPQQLDCLTKLRLTANDMASTIPFILGKFKITESQASDGQNIVLVTKSEEPCPFQVGLLFWPLTIASSIKGIDSDLQRWFRSELVSTGKAIGDNIHTEANLDDWPISF